MKILITGAQGMLGSALVGAVTGAHWESVPMDLEGMDITDLDSVNWVISECVPDVVVNCAAYTDVDGAQEHRSVAWEVNTRGVEHLVTACNRSEARLVQISTDYVFDGTQEEYCEDAERSPINYYGNTKAEAEEIIQAQSHAYQIIRTAWLYGPHGKNFVDTIKDKAETLPELTVVSDQIGSPTYTLDLANKIVALQNEADGVYHVTNSGCCSWFSFAEEIVRLCGSDCTVTPCSTDRILRPAQRPRFSVLHNTKTRQLRSWKDALADYLC